MKCYSILAVCLIIACGSNARKLPAENAEQLSFQQQIEEKVESSQTPLLRPRAEIIRAKADLQSLPGYLPKALEKLRGRKFIVILQVHEVPGTGQLLPQTVVSQKNIDQTLQSLQPKVLLIEGADDQRLNREVLLSKLRTVTDITTGRSWQVPDSTSKIAYQDTIRNNSALRYAVNNPACYAAGSERSSLHTLQTSLLVLGNRVEEEFDSIATLRSWMAVARFTELPEEYQKYDPVLVIGRAHQPDFETLTEEFGINFQFIDTI